MLDDDGGDRGQCREQAPRQHADTEPRNKEADDGQGQRGGNHDRTPEFQHAEGRQAEREHDHQEPIDDMALKEKYGDALEGCISRCDFLIESLRTLLERAGNTTLTEGEVRLLMVQFSKGSPMNFGDVIEHFERTLRSCSHYAFDGKPNRWECICGYIEVVVPAYTCSTCDKPYVKGELNFCSNGFHGCRDCTWVDGRRTVMCPECKEQEAELEEAELAHHDAQMLYPEDYGAEDSDHGYEEEAQEAEG